MRTVLSRPPTQQRASLEYNASDSGQLRGKGWSFSSSSLLSSSLFSSFFSSLLSSHTCTHLASLGFTCLRNETGAVVLVGRAIKERKRKRKREGKQGEKKEESHLAHKMRRKTKAIESDQRVLIKFNCSPQDLVFRLNAFAVGCPNCCLPFCSSPVIHLFLLPCPSAPFPARPFHVYLD